MNVRLCLWLRTRVSRHHDRLDVMVHEPFLPLANSFARANVVAIVQRGMIALVLHAATQIWVSTTSWNPLLRSYAPTGATFDRLPVPSSFGVNRNEAALAQVRAAVRGSDSMVVGHLGTFGTATLGLLGDALARVAVRHECAAFLLLGRGSDVARVRLEAEHPVLAGRLQASGVLDDAGISQHLQACDLMLQPYPDGASCRRTSLMAALQHGLPIVTTTGALTEPCWAERSAVALVAVGDADAFADRACALLDDADARARLGVLATAMYRDEFSADRALERLAAQHETSVA